MNEKPPYHKHEAAQGDGRDIRFGVASDRNDHTADQCSELADVSL